MSERPAYSIWGWGDPDDEPRNEELDALAPAVSTALGFPVARRPVQPLPTAPPPRISPPSSLEAICGDDPDDRSRHALGRSYSDLVRALAGESFPVPDLVVRPRTEQEVADVLSWASDADAAVVPFGGGTSVVGGVGPVPEAAERPLISLDLTELAGLVEVDDVGLAARFRAGTTGPAVEDALRPHDLTLRFFPQSFERSTVGGWLATRAAGHFSARLQHIDDLTESIRAATPSGWWESRRLPGSGAGPSPDRMLLGSEGSLGVITEAWLRVQRRPRFRARATLAAPDLFAGAEAVRRLVQAGLAPASCRLLDAAEARTNGVLDTGEAVLVLAGESADEPVESAMAAAVQLARDVGLRELTSSGGESSAGDTWRAAFKAAPRLRERLVLLGVLVETFETAVPWTRLRELVSTVSSATEQAVREVCGAGRVSCRVTHVYPDGAAPYFTVLAPARAGSELAQWAEIKAAASDAVLASGGTITHHHAVGRDHLPWYNQQRPAPFAAALTAAKRAVDPRLILNPGLWGMQ